MLFVNKRSLVIWRLEKDEPCEIFQVNKRVTSGYFLAFRQKLIARMQFFSSQPYKRSIDTSKNVNTKIFG